MDSRVCVGRGTARRGRRGLVVAAVVAAVVSSGCRPSAGPVRLTAGVMSPAEAATSVATGTLSARPPVDGWAMAVAGPFVAIVQRAAGERDQLVVLDSRSGAVAWTSASAPTYALASPDGSALLAVYAGRVAVLDAATGAVRWDVPAPRGSVIGSWSDAGPVEVVSTDAPPEVRVLDPGTGGVARRLVPSRSCPVGLTVLRGAALGVVCEGSATRNAWAELFGTTSAEPTWSGPLADVDLPVVVGAGLVWLAPSGATEAELVEAASGTVRARVPLDARPVAGRGERATVLRPDGVAERYDAASGRSLGPVRLDGGAERDVEDLDVADVEVFAVGDRLVAYADSFGFVLRREPRLQRRVGAVSWDLTTGARTGRVLLAPDAAFDLVGGLTEAPVHGDSVVALSLRLRTDDGRGRRVIPFVLAP